MGPFASRSIFEAGKTGIAKTIEPQIVEVVAESAELSRIQPLNAQGTLLLLIKGNQHAPAGAKKTPFTTQITPVLKLR